MTESNNAGELIVSCARWFRNCDMRTRCAHAQPYVGMSMGCQYASEHSVNDIICSNTQVYEELLKEALEDEQKHVRGGVDENN